MKNLIKSILSNLNKILVKHGPYKFVVSRWDKITDINTAANIFNTEFFRTEIKPLKLEVSEMKKILILAPHQDDESIGAGGLMLQAQKNDIECNVVFLTDGSQNNLQSHSVEESIQIRKIEAEKACAHSNSKIFELGISNIDFEINQEQINSYINLIDTEKPSEIAIPWFFDGPIKHRFFNEFFALLYPKLTHKKFNVLGYQVHNQIYPNVYLDISNEMDQKEQMIHEYASQNSTYVSYDHITRGINAWNSRYMYQPSQNKKKYSELYLYLPGKEYVKKVNQFYTSAEQIYLGNPTLIKASKQLSSLL